MKNSLLRTRREIPYSPQRVGKQAPSPVKAVLLAAALLLSGCSFPMTKPVATADAVALGPERVLSGAKATPGEGLAHVVVKRDVGMLWAAMSVEIRLDGEPVALLMPSEKVDFYVPYGSHVVSARAGTGNKRDIFAEASILADGQRIPVLRVRFIQEQPYMMLEPTAY